MTNRKIRRQILRYEMTTPFWTKWAQACRYALASTRPPEDQERFAMATNLGNSSRPRVEKFIRGHMTQILLDYRSRLEDLRDGGWPPILNAPGYYRAMNCPPCGISTASRTGSAPCNHRYVCPWCWCRSLVREVYLNVEYAIFGSNDVKNYNARTGREEKNIPKGPWNLLMLERDYGVYERDHTQRMWSDIRDTRALTPQFLDHQGGHVEGLFYLYAIFPTTIPEEKIRGYRVQKRVLALVDEMFKWPEGEKRTERYVTSGLCAQEMVCKKRSRRLLRREIVGAVGMACRYPRELLYGPTDLLQFLLEQRRRRYIPVMERLLRAEAAREEGMEEPGGERAYEPGHGIRLSATLRRFRSRSDRLRNSSDLEREYEPRR